MSTWILAAALLAAPQSPATAPQIEWQRTLADALAVQQASGNPLLVCVNTDGEVFCDRFANTTYLDPEFVATTRGWVAVVASPVRHNPADYDGLGRRIECPRFPGCTCAEHIAIEPELFGRWFRGERYAPRHVGVDTDGKVLFDHFLDRDMQDAIDDIGKHRGSGTLPPLATDAKALLRRRDAASRRALETIYEGHDDRGRIELLQLAGASDTEPVDLLRRGLRDHELVANAAIAALCVRPTATCGIDLQDALARADDRQRPALLAACARLAEHDAPMRQFIAHHRAALAGVDRGATMPPGPTTAATEVTAPAERAEIEAELDAADLAVRSAPDDPRALVRQALANLALARLLLPSGDATTALWFEDARRSAARAESLATAAELPAALGIQAIALRQLDRTEEARALATAALAAVDAAGDGFDGSAPWFGELLATAARAAAATAYAAVTEAPTTVAEPAVAQAATAFTALLRHPAAAPADAAEAATLFAWAGARQHAQTVLSAAILRWPGARDLHAACRTRVLADRGAEGLVAAYRPYAEQVEDEATAEWFTGYAMLVAAEQHVRDRRRTEAITAYSDAIDRFFRSGNANGEFADSANHFAVLARAGRALELHLAGRAEEAVADLLAAIRLRRASMQERDGLERTPAAMLHRIAGELAAQGHAELAARLPPD